MKKAYMASSEIGLPFSEAIEAGGFLFVSGQVHADAEGTLIGNTIEEKTHLTMKNVQNVLEHAGYSFADVVKMEILLTDLTHRKEVSTVYESYLTHPFPARAMIGVKELPQGADIEITAVAYKAG